MSRSVLLILAALSLLPLLNLVGFSGAYLGDPLGELPIKLWVFQTFWDPALWLGGEITAIGYPNTGPLNNPDPVGTLIFNLLRPLFGPSRAYNLFISLELFAAMAAAWALARDLVRDEVAAATAAVAFGFTPLLLVYPVMGAITDMLNVWPYPLAMMFTLRALRRPGWRDGLYAGLFGALGFITCPYNFVVFAIAVIPALLWLPLGLRDRLVPIADELATLQDRRAILRQWGRAILGLGLVMAALGGGFAVHLQSIMNDPDSQMSAEMVAGTRHAPPWPWLWPPTSDRYVAYLSDYFAVGKGEIIVRELGARLNRAFSPGYVVMGLAIFGTLAAPRRRGALLWPLIALFCAVASTGPFLPWSRDHFFAKPINIVWLGLHYGFPGANILLEPFRYGLVVALALSVSAALGVRMLSLRFGAGVGVVAPALIVLEVLALSPVPVPMPIYQPVAHPAYARLDELLPPGPIIELPYTLHGSALFDRTHFYNQTLHHRVIANEVQGFLPRYLIDNEFTLRLLSIENQNTQISVPYRNRQRYEQDRGRLVSDGFVGIVVNPNEFINPAVARQVIQRLEPFGPPVEIDGRLVYRLKP